MWLEKTGSEDAQHTLVKSESTGHRASALPLCRPMNYRSTGGNTPVTDNTNPVVKHAKKREGGKGLSRKHACGPGWSFPVVKVSAHTPKGCRFNPLVWACAGGN